MNTGTVIVYRSRQEENLDWFLNEMLFPWLYTHWYVPVFFLIAIVCFMMWPKKRY